MPILQKCIYPECHPICPSVPVCPFAPLYTCLSIFIPLLLSLCFYVIFVFLFLCRLPVGRSLPVPLSPLHICLFLPVYLSPLYHFAIHPCPSVPLSFCLSVPRPHCMYICISVPLSLCRSFSLSFFPSSLHLSVCLSSPSGLLAPLPLCISLPLPQ